MELDRRPETVEQVLLEVEDVDPALDDKAALVKRIMGEKSVAKMSSRFAPALMAWRIRGTSSQADVRAHAISLSK